MLENKNSEAGFWEQFELYQLRLKAEEDEKLKKENLIAWHKKNVAAMGNLTEEL